MTKLQEIMYDDLFSMLDCEFADLSTEEQVQVLNLVAANLMFKHGQDSVAEGT